MSKIDYQALREKAEKATKGSYIVGHTSVNQHGNLTGVFVCQKWKGEPGGVIAECHVNCLVETDAQAYANAEFIAAFNPNVALALLDERDALNERLAELEADLAGLAEDHQKATESIKQADAAVKLAHEKFSALAAENAKLKKFCKDAAFDADYEAELGMERGGFSDALNEIKTPATDAFLAEVRASAIPDEATERDLFEEWVMEKIFISKTTLEGLRTDDGYRNSTLSGTDYNGMWSQWKAIRAAQLRQEAVQ